MGKYNWKDNYGFDETVSSVAWLSVVGDKNVAVNATLRNRPKYSLGTITGLSNVHYVLSSGRHTGSFIVNADTYQYYHGQGMKDTIFEKSISATRLYNNFYDMKIVSNIGNGASYYIPFYRCDIVGVISNNASFYNCKIRTLPTGGTSFGANSFIGVTIPINKFTSNNLLYDSCEISITSQSDVNLSTSRYVAFDKCKFLIGPYETQYTVLLGNTADELRASFVARCVAAGYTVPSIAEYNESLKASRWIFSNSSAIDGLVLKKSEIHRFEIPRLIAFGYNTERRDSVGITSDKTRANCFSPAYADSNINFFDNSIRLNSSVDVSRKIKASTKSNIIWLNGFYQLKLIDVIHNFPKGYGVFLDSTSTLADTPTTVIEEGKTYLLRSSDTKEAVVTYNGASYSSTLVDIKNVLVGVLGVTSFVDITGNSLLYQVFDNKAMHQTIQMRIANKIPTGNIAAGTPLVDGYWYLVEHDTDQSNTTDYVTYGGVNYPVGSSFIASGTGTFVKIGNVHLRRCWKDDFVYDTETLDKLFWANEQKPEWFDVLPDDLRCLMKNNNSNELEMQTDVNGAYIASGHADFYNSVLGVTGIVKPSYPIKGTYMQLRLVITTQNPM